MFMNLPVELRLRIADYALEQHPSAGLPHSEYQLQEYQGDYRPSENLALLLVCRQFNSDFTPLAYSKTRFPVWNPKQSASLQDLPHHKLRSIRSIVYRRWGAELNSWNNHCFNLEQLHLDNLVFLSEAIWFAVERENRALVAFMRRLLHVKTIIFVLHGEKEGKRRSHYCKLIGAIMKEDHFQRYDSCVRNIEATWWDWHLNSQADTITFTAQQPRPVLHEEDYMLLMKPKIDAMMSEAERAAGL